MNKYEKSFEELVNKLDKNSKNFSSTKWAIRNIKELVKRATPSIIIQQQTTPNEVEEELPEWAQFQRVCDELHMNIYRNPADGSYTLNVKYKDEIFSNTSSGTHATNTIIEERNKENALKTLCLESVPHLLFLGIKSHHISHY